MGESPYRDLGRPPLGGRGWQRRLVQDGGLWREVRVVERTGSTNADLGEEARAGAAEGLVLVAEEQTAGRGRLQRAWSAPARSGLTFSVLLRPEVRPTRMGWLTLLTGLAVAVAVRRNSARAAAGDFGPVTGDFVDVRLKWPNDLLVGERKLAGILAERHGTAVVVGIGLNVSLSKDELPVPQATSLAIENGAFRDREPLLSAILRELGTWYAEWAAMGGDPETSGLRTAYKELCTTLGREVRAELPADEVVTGTAVDVDGDGRLVVRTPAGDRPISAADVVHLRPE